MWNLSQRSLSKNVPQGYVTTTIIFYAILSQNVRTPRALKQEYGNT